MTDTEIGIAGIVALFALFVLRMPVGLSMLTVGVLGNIAMHGHNTPAEGDDFGTRLLKPTVVNICDNDIRPASGHGQRGASADPTGAARDDRHFAVQ